MKKFSFLFLSLFLLFTEGAKAVEETTDRFGNPMLVWDFAADKDGQLYNVAMNVVSGRRPSVTVVDETLKKAMAAGGYSVKFVGEPLSFNDYKCIKFLCGGSAFDVEPSSVCASVVADFSELHFPGDDEGLDDFTTFFNGDFSYIKSSILFLPAKAVLEENSFYASSIKSVYLFSSDITISDDAFNGLDGKPTCDLCVPVDSYEEFKAVYGSSAYSLTAVDGSNNKYYLLSVPATVGGSVAIDGTHSGDLYTGTVTLTITPEEYYSISSVTVNGTAVTVSSDNTVTIDMTAATTVAVTFTRPTYTLNLLYTPDGSGYVATYVDDVLVSDRTAIAAGTVVQCRFVPAEGYGMYDLKSASSLVETMTSHISEVKYDATKECLAGSVVTGCYYYDVTMDHAMVVQAEYRQKYSVTIGDNPVEVEGGWQVAAENGTVTVDKLSFWSGEDVKFTFTATTADYIFTAAAVNEEVITSSVETTEYVYNYKNAAENLVFNAVLFSLPQYTVTVDSPNGVVTINGSVKSVLTADKNKRIKIALKPLSGYEVESVVTDVETDIKYDVDDKAYYFTLTEDVTVSVSYKVSQIWTLTLSNVGNGQIVAAQSELGDNKYYDGTLVQLTLNYTSPTYFRSLTRDGSAVSLAGNTYSFTIGANTSFVATFADPMTVVADGNEASVSDATATGELAANSSLVLSAGSWTPKDVQNLKKAINGSTNLTEIDFDAISIVSGETYDFASFFNGCKYLKSVDLTKFTNVSDYSGAFKGCTNLQYVKLPSINSEATDVFLNANPNCLKYISDYTSAGLWASLDGSLENVIDAVANTCETLKVTPYKPFNAPVAFKATSAEYVRDFPSYSDTKEGGFYSIWLPFAPQHVLGAFADSESPEDIFWVGQSNPGGYSDYWLRKMVSSTADGVVYIEGVGSGDFEANVPYLIAFPNSAYGEQNNLSDRDITFKASDVQVLVSENIQSSGDFQSYRYFGTTEPLSASTQRYVLNNNGSGFKQQNVSLAGLDGYLSAVVAGTGAPRIVLNTGSETGLGRQTLADRSAVLKAYGVRGALVVESVKDCELKVYDMQGSQIVEENIEAGKVEIPLSEGMYVVNGIKVVVY